MHFDAFLSEFTSIVDTYSLIPTLALYEDAAALALAIEGPVRINIDDWKLCTSFQGYNKRESEDVATR